MDKCFDEIVFPFDKKEYFVYLLRSLNQSNYEEIANVQGELIGNVDHRKKLSVSTKDDEKSGAKMLGELISFATQPISDAVADCTTFGTGIAKLPSVAENNESSTSTESSVPGRKRKQQPTSSTHQKNDQSERLACFDEEDK